MKKALRFFSGLTLVLILASTAYGESDYVPGPTLRPTIAPSPAFSIFYDPPTVPGPSPVPTRAATPVANPFVAVPIPTPTPVATPTSAPAPMVVRPKLLPPVTISVFAGGDFISFNEVNQLVGTDLFKSTIYYGGELRYPVSFDFSVLFRAERMSKGSSVGAASFSLSSLPVMAGLDFHSHHQRKFRFHASVLAGLALGTNLTETASSLPSPNVTEFSSTTLTEMARLSLEIPLSHTVGVFGEGGYRFLKTSTVAPSQTGSGGTIFQSNGQYQAVPLNLSGPFIGGGFVFVL